MGNLFCLISGNLPRNSVDRLTDWLDMTLVVLPACPTQAKFAWGKLIFLEDCPPGQPESLEYNFVSFLFKSLLAKQVHYKWAASSVFGIYRLCEQRRFRRSCISKIVGYFNYTPANFVCGGVYCFHVVRLTFRPCLFVRDGFGFSLISWKGYDGNSSNFADTLILIRCMFIIEN